MEKGPPLALVKGCQFGVFLLLKDYIDAKVDCSIVQYNLTPLHVLLNCFLRPKFIRPIGLSFHPIPFLNLVQSCEQIRDPTSGPGSRHPTKRGKPTDHFLV